MGAVFIVGLLQQTEGKILSQTVFWWCQAELSNLILISTEILASSDY